MARDVEALSPKAAVIFARLKPFYPLGAFQQVQWEEAGRVYDNGWHDLRLSADRERLENWNKSMIGYLVRAEASMFVKAHGSLDDFTRHHFTTHMKELAEQLLILDELSFQIETLDICEE